MADSAGIGRLDLGLGRDITNAAHAGDAVRSYLGALAAGEADAVLAALHPIFDLKRVTTDDRIETTERAWIIEDKSQRAIASSWRLSALHLCFSDFAIARLDAWGERRSSVLLLFCESGRWSVAGQASTDFGSGSGGATFQRSNDEAAVLAVLGEYYRAVTEGDADTIDRIFAPEWTMRNHEGDRLVREGKGAFIDRIKAGPLPSYRDDRQIDDVQVIANRLAFVRVDRPSTPSTTVFNFMKVADGWLMVDKAWTDGRKT